MIEFDTAAEVAAILNAGYLVRHYSRPHQRAERERAYAEMARAAVAALSRASTAAPVLHAVADSLKP